MYIQIFVILKVGCYLRARMSRGIRVWKVEERPRSCEKEITVEDAETIDAFVDAQDSQTLASCQVGGAWRPEPHPPGPLVHTPL